MSLTKLNIFCGGLVAKHYLQRRICASEKSLAMMYVKAVVRKQKTPSMRCGSAKSLQKSGGRLISAEATCSIDLLASEIFLLEFFEFKNQIAQKFSRMWPGVYGRRDQDWVITPFLIQKFLWMQRKECRNSTQCRLINLQQHQQQGTPVGFHLQLLYSR